VDEIYALTAEKLQQARTPQERVRAFKEGLGRAYEAGVDAQRELSLEYPHDRPTPVPPPPIEPVEDPGTLPESKPQATPGGLWRGSKKE
jgi:hypothetical protein